MSLNIKIVIFTLMNIHPLKKSEMFNIIFHTLIKHQHNAQIESVDNAKTQATEVVCHSSTVICKI